MLAVLGKMRRCHAIRTRCCPYVEAFEYAPMRRLPCGINSVLPVALSNTLWLTCARIGPGRSELIPLTNTAGITLPAITVNGDAGGRRVTVGSVEELESKLPPEIGRASCRE